MKKKVWLAGLCAVLTAGIVLVFARKQKNEAEAETEMKNVDITEEGAVVLTDFGIQLLQNIDEKEKNILISPFSVICALGMTANGAEGQTLEQMEQVLGIKTEELNLYLSAYRNALPKAEKYKLSAANSIWLKEDKNFTVKQDFLQINKTWYEADIYKETFDASVLEKMNHWVEEHTDGMIPEILSQVPEDAVMYLINALAFDAEWETIYRESQIHEGIFTTEDERKQKAELMYSEESRYLEDENAIGFLKYYADRKYAFAALLPKEGMHIEEYIASLTGEKLHKILSEPENITVNAAIPKFQSESSMELSEVFYKLGMQDAFNSKNADFSGIGSYKDENLYISKILHKTFIAVDEKGTKAGAATAVEMVRGLAMVEEKQVYLNRPFVYLLIDCKANVPVFIGTVMDLEK